jgi:hypothetical protein
MVYYGEFANKEEGNLLLSLFDQENDRLMNTLDNYHKHNNYLQLKTEVTDFLKIQNKGKKNDRKREDKQEFTNLMQVVEFLQKHDQIT